MMRTVFAISIFGTTLSCLAQDSLTFSGQASLVGSYGPENALEYFFGARYLPEVQYEVKIDSTKLFTVLGSANLSATSFFHPFTADVTDGSIDPYRVWARYSTNRYEIRVGLQKIDFGSATLLRPMQWFNQIDPRDPLQLTNGVYGALARYYFKNNANIWLWALYGNDEARGLDALPSDPDRPEFGGRVQLPVPRGEIALSYHNRTVDTKSFGLMDAAATSTENRIGLDGKWDVTIGLWFEVSHAHNSADLGLLSDQTLINIGADYTIGIGNGLNVVAEHLLSAADDQPLAFNDTRHITAATANYPIGFTNTLSTVAYYDWSSENATFFLNFQHQFRRLTGYLMAYYNPSTQTGVQRNDLVQTSSGPGIRAMLVYNH